MFRNNNENEPPGYLYRPGHDRTHPPITCAQARKIRLTRRVLGLVALALLVLGLLLYAKTAEAACTPPPPPANWKITDAQVCTSTTIQLTGNLYIASGGSLHLDDSTLEFQSTSDGEFESYVKSGGAWTATGGSTVTAIGDGLFFTVWAEGESPDFRLKGVFFRP